MIIDYLSGKKSVFRTVMRAQQLVKREVSFWGEWQDNFKLRSGGKDFDHLYLTLLKEVTKMIIGRENV